MCRDTYPFSGAVIVYRAKRSHRLKILVWDRQAQIPARQGVMLERSTLSFWMGYAAAEVAPVVARLREMMLASTRLFDDETVVPVLDTGRGRTKEGYFARDDRPWGGSQPPAVAYSYAPGRGHTHANTLLRRGAVAPQLKAARRAIGLSGAVTRHPVEIPSDRHPAEAAARADTGDESAWHARFSASQDRDAEAAKVVRGPRPGSLCRAAAQCRLVIAAG